MNLKRWKNDECSDSCSGDVCDIIIDEDTSDSFPDKHKNNINGKCRKSESFTTSNQVTVVPKESLRISTSLDVSSPASRTRSNAYLYCYTKPIALPKTRTTSWWIQS